jgi:hypothetical protein
MSMPKCPHCPQEENPRVTLVGSVQKSAYYPNYFDSDGKEHSHNENSISTTYECQNRHRFSERTVSRCWCGWPNAEQEFKVLYPGKTYVPPKEAKPAKKETVAAVTVDTTPEPAKVEE